MADVNKFAVADDGQFRQWSGWKQLFCLLNDMPVGSVFLLFGRNGHIGAVFPILLDWFYGYGSRYKLVVGCFDGGLWQTVGKCAVEFAFSGSTVSNLVAMVSISSFSVA